MSTSGASGAAATLAESWPEWPTGGPKSSSAAAPALPSPQEYSGLAQAPKDETLAAWCPELKDLPAGGAVKFTDLLRGLPPRDMRPPMSELARLGQAQLSRFELRQDGHKPPPPPEPAAPKITLADNIMNMAIALFEAKPRHVAPANWLAPDPRTVSKKALACDLLKAVSHLQLWRARIPECREIIDRLLATLERYGEKRDARKRKRAAEVPAAAQN